MLKAEVKPERNIFLCHQQKWDPTKINPIFYFYRHAVVEFQEVLFPSHFGIHVI